jgi:arabinogalactan oligomer/maltooligosaccharide transport system permease protein
MAAAKTSSLSAETAWNSKTFSWGFVAKLILMMLVNALGVYIIFFAYTHESWWVLGVMAVILVALDYVYFTNKHTLPLKYILPGVIFLLVFQVFVIFYTAAVAFTNYGDGHNLSKEQAVASILAQTEVPVENSPTFPLAVVKQGGEFGFAIIRDDKVFAGTAEEPLREISGAQISGSQIAQVPGYDLASMGEMAQNQEAIFALRVPYSDNPTEGSIRTGNATIGSLYKPSMVYDQAADTITDTAKNIVYTANGHGKFQAADGLEIDTGWQVFVGFENFTKAFSDQRYAGPFVRVLAWNITFALLSVVTTFLLGLFLAAVFNDERLKGRKIYRTLLLLPYAFPAFLSALIWSGLLNKDFGFINQIFLGGAEIPWLTDDWLAKLSILGVNLWLGFPYMFLIATGALQSLPGDIMEAAKIDGANPLRTWWSVSGPLVLISTAPVLIASFSFNFNNFTLIYMLTGGGPRFADTSAPVGATDILISMVYSISGVDGHATKDYGLASALSIMIFAIVAIVSGLGFRQTRKLEEML